jgi:glycosyltransferase involved in cell wall biosynthesis
MRIGLNLLYLIPGEVGGTETYARGLIEALAQEDVRNEYTVFINCESRHLDFIHHPHFKIVECRLKATNRVARFLWEQFILPGQVRRAGLDLLHSLGYVAPLYLPCKSVVTIHDLNYKYVPQSMTVVTRSVQRLFVEASAHRTDHIIAVSEFVRGQLINYLKFPPEKITTIHEAVERNVFTHAKPGRLLLSSYGLSRPYIFAFSSLTPHKNIASLIKAFQRINEIIPGAYQLVITGHQPRGNQSLKEEAIKLGLKDSVIFTGYLERPDINALLSGAAVFAFPSFYEGFGLPVLEAMSCGTPVACSERAALPEIAGDAALYFDPGDVEQMAKVLLKILQDEPGRQFLRQRAEKNLERFSWEKTARQTVAVYTSYN